MPGSNPCGTSTVVQCRSCPQQPPQLTTSPMGNRPDALLVVDGRHLRQALDRLVVATVEQQARVVKELVAILEDAYRVTFIQKTIHDATMTGKPDALHRLLMAEGGHVRRSSSFLTKIRPMTPRTGTRIDPETLEPMSDKAVTIMVEEGVGMSLCLDVLGAVAKPFKAVVVVTADGDLAQALQQASASGMVHMSVCGMREAMAPSLLKYVRDPSSPSSGVRWLESLLITAMERVVAKGEGGKTPYRGKCGRGRQCQVQDLSHRMAYLHPCADWSMCDLVPKPNEVSPTNGRYWMPEDRLDLEHIQRFQHPCPLTNCSIKGSEHHVAWDHSEHHQRQGVLVALQEGMGSSNNRPSIRRPPQDRSKFPSRAHHLQEEPSEILTPGSPQHDSSFWHFHSFDHSSSYTENNAPDKRPKASLPFKGGEGEVDDDEEMQEFMKILRYTFTRTPAARGPEEEEEEEGRTAADFTIDPAGNEQEALFPMSM